MLKKLKIRFQNIKFKFKNCKKDREAFKNQTLKNIEELKPFIFECLWFSFILFLIFSYIGNDYSIKSFGLSFAIYVMYQSLFADYREVIVLKK